MDLLMKRAMATQIGTLTKTVTFITENQGENTRKRVGEDTEPES